jgi:hypothetical protein
LRSKNYFCVADNPGVRPSCRAPVDLHLFCITALKKWRAVHNPPLFGALALHLDFTWKSLAVH